MVDSRTILYYDTSMRYEFDQEKFAEVLKKHPGSAVALAAAAGVSEGAIRSWATGRVVPKVSTFARAMSALRRSPAAFFRRVEDVAL